jgi:hypothetical protein
MKMSVMKMSVMKMSVMKMSVMKMSVMISLGERFHEPPRLMICSPEPPSGKHL